MHTLQSNVGKLITFRIDGVDNDGVLYRWQDTLELSYRAGDPGSLCVQSPVGAALERACEGEKIQAVAPGGMVTVTLLQIENEEE